jgi:hypothetical protein
MTVRYANDLIFTDLARRLKALHQSMDAYITDGNFEAVILRAKTMKKTLDGLRVRAEDIRDGRV